MTENEIKTTKQCQECKKDWTKCGKCPVMMKWIKEQKARRRYENTAM